MPWLRGMVNDLVIIAWVRFPVPLLIIMKFEGMPMDEVIKSKIKIDLQPINPGI